MVPDDGYPVGHRFAGPGFQPAGRNADHLVLLDQSAWIQVRTVTGASTAGCAPSGITVVNAVAHAIGNGSMRGMRTTMDKAGRLVIPRVLRDRIGMTDGGEVELELDGAGVRIDPVSTGELVEEDGFLFIPATGKRLTDDMVRELIDADRHRR